jgi:hypothetical protein
LGNGLLAIRVAGAEIFVNYVSFALICTQEGADLRGFPDKQSARLKPVPV